MARRKGSDDVADFIARVSALFLLGSLVAWFLGHVLYGFIGFTLFLLTIAIPLFFFTTKRKRLNKIYLIVKNDLEKFIHRNHTPSGKVKIGAYKYSDYSIEVTREELMKRYKVKISEEGMVKLLEKVVNDEERDNTIASTFGDVVKNLQSLSGTEFEQLLQRLFNAQGYVVVLNGKSGDQGADLILTKDGTRTVVQAKRYSHPVSNKAIQEAVAAKAVFDCSFAMVVTTSNFTRGAFENGKANGVQMIWGKELKKLLREHLGEQWI